MLTYSEFQNLPSSEKIVLLHLDCNEEAKGFTLHSGSTYKKQVDFFVFEASINGTSLTQVGSIGSLVNNSFYYDQNSAFLYVYCSNPDENSLKVGYRLFLSTTPLILPYDLISGYEVEYEPRVLSTSRFGHDLDSDQIGTALDGQGSVTLINNDGYFDEIYEKLNFENQSVKIWSWSDSLPLSEKKLIYKGFISGKSFSSDSVSFELRDFMSKLNSDINLGKFDGGEGSMPNSQINKPKRRIYGRVSGLRCNPLDNIKDGFNGIGLIVGESGSKNIQGISTYFLTELSPDDEIKVNNKTYKVESITDDLNLVLSTPLEENIGELPYLIAPKITYRLRNRVWFIAHHELKKISCNIVNVVAPNRFEVSTIEDFANGDLVVIGGEIQEIRRVSGSQIVLDSNLNTLPLVGDEIYKYPIQSVKEGFKEFVLFRDYVLSYEPYGAVVQLDNLAEFNITKEFPFVGSATFTNGSRIVTGSGTSFDTDFKPRDWVKADLSSVWYEILSVDSPTQLTLRIAFAEPTVSTIGQKKNIEFLNDESVLLVDCYGKTEDGTESGTWIKYGPQVIKDVLKDIGLESEINIASFQTPTQLISLKLPLSYGSTDIPSARNVIDLVNKSILGSLFNNNDFEIEFSLIESSKPVGMKLLNDDDVISWNVISDNKDLVGEFICDYRHEDYDPTTGEETASYKSKVNSFTRDFLGISQTKTESLYLYNASEAEAITQRYALMNEVTKNRLEILTKLNLADSQINDKILVNFERLFKRTGGLTRYKAGIINSIKKDGFNVSVVVDDLGNLWNRVANIADNASNEYANASDLEKSLNGYITDENGLVLGLDFTNRTNIIG